jgi:5-methylcytosine-specific restriction endonuclease McrA
MKTKTNKAKKWNGSKWIRPEKRLAIYLRDEFCCVYCGRDLHHAAPEEINLDHIKCRSHGGSNDATNLVTSCKTCNCSRGNKKISAWADEATRRTIRRQTRRSLRRPLELAKSIISEK